jgi:ribosomal protein S18 acetylase RimI-like enzyme
MGAIGIEFLEPGDTGLLHEIDRTERLEIEYRVVGRKLVSSESSVLVPAWDRAGSGDHSVNQLIAFCDRCLEGGAQLLGAFRDGAIVGMAVVEPSLRPNLGWLALLHVSNGQRRAGVGQALWDASVAVARSSGATDMYVSATPTGSAVGFYRKQGCRLASADELVQELYELEPDDVHLMRAIEP